MRDHETRGCRTAYFSPAHDPEMNSYAENSSRPIDILFVGTYSRHHVRRNAMLRAIARLAGHFNVAMHLYNSRLTLLAESKAGSLIPGLKKHRRPAEIRAISRPPLFGRDFYAAMSHAKVAFNGTGEIAGRQRGNMRCFEAMGLRNVLLGDDGVYPDGMVSGQTMETYGSEDDVVRKIEDLLGDPGRCKRIADAGFSMIQERYSKQLQWRQFLGFV
jgi:spore maturation protein CgeB